MAGLESFDVDTVAQHLGMEADACRRAAAAVLVELHRVARTDPRGAVAALMAAYAGIDDEACFHLAGLIEAGAAQPPASMAAVLGRIDPDLMRHQSVVDEWLGASEIAAGPAVETPATVAGHDDDGGRSPVRIVITWADVRAGHTAGVLSRLRRLLDSPETIRARREDVVLGFDDDEAGRTDASSSPEMREFVARLDDEFPYWFFFLDKRTPGLMTLVRCFLPVSAVPGVDEAGISPRLTRLLDGRWWPALDAICALADVPDDEASAVKQRSREYLERGPLL